MDAKQIKQAGDILKQGGVIAYPTESVYGFGCDPSNHEAVTRILQIKQRPLGKGFILVAANFEQLDPYIEPIEPRMLANVQASWPGPYTWIFPARPNVPEWVRGQYPTIAVRISDHPVVTALCYQFGAPIISTSANRSGEMPSTDYFTTKMNFGPGVDYIVNDKTGGRSRPTEIRDAITGEVLRNG